MAKKFRELREAAMARGMKLLSIHDIKMLHNDDYAEGFKAGREAGMREASEIADDRCTWMIDKNMNAEAVGANLCRIAILLAIGGDKG